MRILVKDRGDAVATTMFSEFIDADEPVLVYFWAPWCGPCKAAREVLEKLEKELPSISFGQLNVDDEPEICQEYDIASIPAFFLFKGGKAVKGKVGFSSYAQLREWLTAP